MEVKYEEQLLLEQLMLLYVTFVPGSLSLILQLSS